MTHPLRLDGIRAVLIDLDGTLVDTAGDFSVASSSADSFLTTASGRPPGATRPCQA